MSLVVRVKMRLAVGRIVVRVLRSALRVNVCVSRLFVGQGPVLSVVQRNLNQKNRYVALGLTTLNQDVIRTHLHVALTAGLVS